MSENKEVISNQEVPQVSAEIINRPTEIVDLKQEAPVPREVKTWMQRLEEDPNLSQNTAGLKGDSDSVLEPIAPTVTKITLPTDKKTFTEGFGKPVNEAWRWFSEFVLRIIKKNQGKVKFKEE